MVSISEQPESIEDFLRKVDEEAAQHGEQADGGSEADAASRADAFRRNSEKQLVLFDRSKFDSGEVSRVPYPSREAQLGGFLLSDGERIVRTYEIETATSSPIHIDQILFPGQGHVDVLVEFIAESEVRTETRSDIENSDDLFVEAGETFIPRACGYRVLYQTGEDSVHVGPVVMTNNINSNSILAKLPDDQVARVEFFDADQLQNLQSIEAMLDKFESDPTPV